MRSRESDAPAFLEDIRSSATLVLGWARNLKFSDFAQDLMLQKAVIQCLEEVGEASKHVPEKTRRHYPTVPWTKMIKFRDYAARHYWSVDLLQIWEIVIGHLPTILDALSTS